MLLYYKTNGYIEHVLEHPKCVLYNNLDTAGWPCDMFID